MIKSFLKHGDVLVKVDYSGLNYKDALILKKRRKIGKRISHIPGVDFSGKVVESKNENYREGDNVIATGWRIGELYLEVIHNLQKLTENF